MRKKGAEVKTESLKNRFMFSVVLKFKKKILNEHERTVFCQSPVVYFVRLTEVEQMLHDVHHVRGEAQGDGGTGKVVKFHL